MARRHRMLGECLRLGGIEAEFCNKSLMTRATQARGVPVNRASLAEFFHSFNHEDAKTLRHEETLRAPDQTVSFRPTIRGRISLARARPHAIETAAEEL
jgi:hypothetical protein